MLFREGQIAGIIDFSPREVERTGKSNLDALVGELLDRHIEELFLVACLDQVSDLLKKPFLNTRGEDCDTNVCSAEFTPRNLLAHAYDLFAGNYDFHRFITPVRVHNHGNRRWRVHRLLQKSV